MNGEKIENTIISNPESTNNVLNFIFSYKYFDTIPKTKNLMILYEYGSDLQKLLLDEEYSIIVNQKNYDNSISDNYSFKVQDPLDLIVGNNIYLYLLIYDENGACYYGDFNLLMSIEIYLKIREDELYKTNIKSRVKIEGYSACEYIYLVDFNRKAKISGNFDITIKDNIHEYESKIHISPKDIDESKSYISGNSEVQVGRSLYLSFSGTDSEGNSVNFYDLINEVDIILIDTEGNELEKKEDNYIYEIKVNSNNSGLEIFLKINNCGSYLLKMIKNGIEMKLLNEFRVSVQSLECSLFEPNIEILPIDYRNDYYYKEKITIQIKCKDILGNHVDKKGNEIFKAYIQRDDLNDIYEFDEYFKEGLHYIPFYLEEEGNYNINIFLNGKKYGESLQILIKTIDNTKYNCMNKIQVENLEDCDTDIYRILLQEILGDSYVCYFSTEKGSLYKCNQTDVECVKHTNQCPCLEGTSWQGYCYPTGFNPIEQVNTNLIKCISTLSNVVSCGDGSCRYNKEECLTNFECPLGFKPCGNKCILINENCYINIVCNENEVLCWDLSCAEGYDNCPTRITCSENKVLCPDGTCQQSGHCIQPPNRKCDNDQYQCADFSCVYNREDCPKNIICDPGLSLCENKTCNQFCKNISDIDMNIDDSDNVIKTKRNKGGWIGGLVGGLFGRLLIGSFLFYFLYWRKRSLKQKIMENLDLNTDEHNSNMVKNKEKITIYNNKDIDNKDNKGINHDNHFDIDEIKEENEITSKEGNIRVIKNAC